METLPDDWLDWLAEDDEDVSDEEAEVDVEEEREMFLKVSLEDTREAQTARRAEMEETVGELAAAGEEALVETCPSCGHPQIVLHRADPLFECQDLHCLVRSYRVVRTLPSFGVTKLLPSKSDFGDLDPMVEEYKNAEEEYNKMHQKGNHTGLEIHSIDIVRNVDLQLKFDARKAELVRQGELEERLLFHGTAADNIGSILKDNFNLSKIAHGRAHGHGVYFSEQPQVSLWYCGTGKKGKVEKQASLVLCRVLMGKSCKEVKKDGSGRCWAVVVPEIDNILPKYVINLVTKRTVIGGRGPRRSRILSKAPEHQPDDPEQCGRCFLSPGVQDPGHLAACRRERARYTAVTLQGDSVLWAFSESRLLVQVEVVGPEVWVSHHGSGQHRRRLLAYHLALPVSGVYGAFYERNGPDGSSYTLRINFEEKVENEA